MQVAQLVLNGLMAGTILALPAIGLTLIFAVLRFTNFALASLMTIGAGKAMRAVADNPSLASIKGIDVDMVARIVSFVAMGLAGIGGMLVGLDTTVDPLVGFKTILSVFAAAVVGGLGSIPGAIVGALVVGVGEELSLLGLSPAYRTAIGFLAIFVVLTLRPRGILGARAY